MGTSAVLALQNPNGTIFGSWYKLDGGEIPSIIHQYTEEELFQTVGEGARVNFPYKEDLPSTPVKAPMVWWWPNIKSFLRWARERELPFSEVWYLKTQTGTWVTWEGERY